jgi:hypothetical protein
MMCNKNYLKITCAEFGVKVFVLVRDTATNDMYYMIEKPSSFLHRE